MAYTTIDDPEAHYQTQLYTGDGAANNAITLGADTDMQPDLVWIKNRDATDSHCIFDALRGATKLLSSDTADGEATDADTLDSFASDGFQVDADVKVNTSSEKYVAWCWKANGTGSSNTDGTINTTATSANTTAKFSIVTYTGNGTAGATIGHGLGVVPTFIILKSVSMTGGAAEAWRVYHGQNTAAPETDYLALNTTAATADALNAWNDVAPTSSVFSLGDGGGVNTDSETNVAYVWRDVQGFSKFGSYTGNGNAEGPFVYTGFRPAWLLIKKTSADNDWLIYDNKREGYNVDNDYFLADTTAAEADDTDIDIVSNGFKIRGDAHYVNTSAGTYVYAAFAEAPFVNSNGVPCNAR